MTAQTAPPVAPVAPLIVVLLFAVVTRAAGYSGFFGSDEVTYTESAFKLLQGDWAVAAYVGANRYGVNLPVAALGALLGQNEVAAALWSLLCSVGEVGLITWFGMRRFGIRTGVLAGLLLASLPIHVHFAGRLMADAPLALAISASFVLFLEGERRGSSLAFLGAGLAAGFSFWIKQGTIFYLCVFLLYPLLFRRFDLRWGWMLFGLALAIAANFALFAGLSGDPWFMVRAVRERQGSGYLEQGLASGAMVDTPLYYLDYLFVRVFHTGALGLLVVAAILWAPQQGPARSAYRQLLWWGLGLLALLSMLPIRFSPLIFVPKQTNYMLMFVAPLCLLAALTLARLPSRTLAVASVVVLGPAVFLSLLQQASVRVFTANSRAAVAFVRVTQPAAPVFGTTNAHRAATFDALVHPARGPSRIGSMDDLAAAPANIDRLMILDTENWNWSSNEPIRRLQDVPACAVRTDTLTPQVDGLGVQVARSLGTLSAMLPASAAVSSRIGRLVAPAPAYVYRLPPGCQAPARKP